MNRRFERLVRAWGGLDREVRWVVVASASLALVTLAYAAARSKDEDEEEPMTLEIPGWTKSQPFILALHESVRPMAQALLEQAWNEGIALVVTQGYRSLAEQDRLYQQGRTTPGAIVTNAPPGSSWHNFGLAFDVAILDSSGQPSWPNDTKLWSRIGQIGKAQGLSWGGDFKSFVDRPHFEHRGGLTLADVQAGARPSGYG